MKNIFQFITAVAVVAPIAISATLESSSEESMLGKEQENSKTILAIFRAIEERNDAQFRSLLQPDFEIHWPRSLPYGGTFRGLEPQPHSWGATWAPLQPTEEERKMDARVVATHDDDVVVLWRQRGRTSEGDILDEEVLGLYHFHKGKLARAQMFYFDTAPVAKFLEKAKHTTENAL
jgi:ketosteroid isomerase-like protein